MFQILIVEDDKNTRKLMEAVLKENGYYPILLFWAFRNSRLLWIDGV